MMTVLSPALAESKTPYSAPLTPYTNHPLVQYCTTKDKISKVVIPLPS